jgi:predicted acylesterase/phospholipase RssA
VTDATNGIKKAIDLDKVSNEDAVFWTTASTSIPAVFQSLILNETVYVDGGVI